MLPIKQVLADTSNYQKGRGNHKIEYLVIHYTGNDGDSDEANVKYFQGANRGASAHYFVDDDSITQSVLDTDTAWSVGKIYNATVVTAKNCKNQNSISIEMCDTKKNGVYDLSDRTRENVIQLAAYLIKKYSIPSSNVVRHYDVCGKICPAYFVKSIEAWNQFKKDVFYFMAADEEKEAVTKAITKLQEKGVITTSDYWINNYDKLLYLDKLLIKVAEAL